MLLFLICKYFPLSNYITLTQKKGTLFKKVPFSVYFYVLLIGFADFIISLNSAEY